MVLFGNVPFGNVPVITFTHRNLQASASWARVLYHDMFGPFKLCCLWGLHRATELNIVFDLCDICSWYFWVFMAYYSLKMANSGLGVDSNHFFCHVGNFQDFTKSGPMDPIFITKKCFSNTQKIPTHFKTYNFYISQHLGNQVFEHVGKPGEINLANHFCWSKTICNIDRMKK